MEKPQLQHLGSGKEITKETARAIVYPSAALGIVHDIANNTQRYYYGHTGDIVSLALHPRGKIVATGQIGREPMIHIWDSTNTRCLGTVSGFHQRGVSHLVFSEDGTKLISVGYDDDHSVAVHDW